MGKKTVERSLDDWLDVVEVGQVDRTMISDILQQGKDLSMFEGWYHVSTEEDGVIAYFLHETDAFRFRLDYINRKLNP